MLNGEHPYDQLESDQPQEDEKQQSNIKQNNSVPSGLSDSQASRSQILTKDKNAFCEHDRTVPNSPCTAMQYVRDHEVAVGENNEQHGTRWEIEAQVDNNLTTHEPDNDAFDDGTHHDSTSTPQMVVATSLPVFQIEEESVTTLAAGDHQGQVMQSDMNENVCTTPADTHLNSKREACSDCDGTVDHEEEPLQPLNSEQNSVKHPPLMAVSPQPQLDVDVYSPQHGSGEISVDSQLISSPPEQQQTVIGDLDEDPLQNLSDLASDSSQQLSDTSELKDGPPQCRLDENPTNLLPHVAVSQQQQQQQPDPGDQEEGPPQLHSDDSAAPLSLHVVVPPTQPQPQHLAVDDGKDDPLKRLLSVKNSLSDYPPEGGTVQDCPNENIIDKFSPCAAISSQQELDAGDHTEVSSPHLSDKYPADNLSPTISESSKQHSHSGDLDEDQQVQDHSDKNSVNLSSCSSDSLKQQLDAGNDCPPQLPSERKSQVDFVAATQPWQQSYSIGQKEGLLQSASDVSEHSPPAVIPLQKSDKHSDKDLLACTGLSPQPARVSVNVRKKGHWKCGKHYCKKHQRGKVRHSKPRKRRLDSSELPQAQPSKSKEPGPANRNNDSCPTNRGRKNLEKQDGSGGHKCSRGEQGSSCTQQSSSFEGNGDDDGDKDRDREPYSGGRKLHAQHKDLNWILLLLMVLLILCFCIPQQASHTDTESVCSAGQHQTTPLDLKSSHFPDSSLDECTPALFRGGIFSKQRENGGEESASSSTFPGGYSTDHLVSEEETPRFMGQGEEMAGLKKLHLKRRERESPKITPYVSSGVQLDFNISREDCPLLMSEPKIFTCPSPDDNGQEVSHDYDASRYECTCIPDLIDKHMIFHSNCVFKSSKLTCRPNPNVRHILTDVNIYHHQQSPPLHYVTNFSIAHSSNSTLEHEGDEEQGDDDPPSQFRGPGTTYKKSPGRSEGHALDSGVGTKSASNQVPTTQIPPVAATTIDTSWRTSLKKDKIVYLRPSIDDAYHSSFQTILSMEEQTPRSPNYRDELVGVKQFNHNDNSKKELADALSFQPPEPLLERCEWTSLLLEPSMRAFPYPLPGDDESFLDFHDIPGDIHVFVAGSILYTSQKPSSPAMCSVLTDATIDQSQRYPLRYFTTKY